MQPYFLPYVGYFQLINTVDKFVVYDDIQYIKKGWINRNKYLLNNEDRYFTISVEKSSQKQEIFKINISKDYKRGKILQKFLHAYYKAPYFDETYKLLNKMIMFPSENLFEYIFFRSLLSVNI